MMSCYDKYVLFFLFEALAYFASHPIRGPLAPHRVKCIQRAALMRIDPSPGQTVLNDAEYLPDAAFSVLPDLNLMWRRSCPVSTSLHRHTSYEVTAFKRHLMSTHC